MHLAITQQGGEPMNHALCTALAVPSCIPYGPDNAKLGQQARGPGYGARLRGQDRGAPKVASSSVMTLNRMEVATLIRT